MGEYRSAYIVLFAIAAGILIVSAAAGQQPFLTYFNPGGLSKMAPLWVLPPLIWLAIMTVRLMMRGRDRPLTTIGRMARKHRSWLLRGAAFTLLALPLGRAFAAFKSSIPTHTYYWADPVFADLERSLLFGNDAWRLTHAVLGNPATAFIDIAYALWFFVMMGMLAWLNFTGDIRLQLRGLLSYILTWSLLGMFGAMTFASVGPIFYDQFHGGERFSELRAILDAQPDLNMHIAARFLYENRTGEALGSGISAMPSLHVAIAFLLVLVCRHAGVHRYLRWSAIAFFGLIFVGSIHLGWHYALDGLVSVAGVSAIWWAVGKFVDAPQADRRPASVPEVLDTRV